MASAFTLHPLEEQLNKNVLAIAQEKNARLFLVGGFVRDSILGRYDQQNPPKDFDYSVAEVSAIEFAQVVAERLDGHFVLLDKSNDTARVVVDGIWIDFAGCVGGKIETDVKRRDFTVNSLVWDPQKPDEVLDLVGGMDDLKKQLIRSVSQTVLHEDPLRLLRAFRFSASLDFDIDDQTLSWIKESSLKLNSVAGERISHELFAVMETKNAGKATRLLGKYNLLEVIFPEITATHRVTPNAYHHLNLYDHSLETLAHAEKGAPEFPEWAKHSFKEEISQGVSRLAATKLASLLHDIGKPDTWEIQEDGRHTFIGHDKLGAQMCDAIAKRMKWSKNLDRFISALVRWHLRPGQLFHQGLPTDKAIHRFHRSMGDTVPELILLALSDFRSTCGPGLQEGRDVLEKQLRELLDSYAVFIEGRKKIPRLLDGNDVMKLLGVNPGPIVGELLIELEEAQGLREVKNKQQAEAFIQQRYREKYSS